MISGRVQALNLTVPLGSGRVGSDDLGYGPGSGFSFEPVQTSTNNADDLKAAIKATCASITPEQCHKLIASMPRCIDAVIHAKGGPTKY